MSDMQDPRLYRQIAEYVRQGVSEKRWKPGEPVPSITVLVQEFGVARRTAAKALQLLEAEGLLVKFEGKGFYVR